MNWEFWQGRSTRCWAKLSGVTGNWRSTDSVWMSRSASGAGSTRNCLWNYFERNAERMRYPEFRRKGLFVGSGVIEAGCKTVIGTRLKRSGMFWTVRAANAVIALRCCRHSRQFDDYWEHRRA
jgi:hypothetical protein